MNEQGEPVFEVYLDNKLDRVESPEQRGLWKSKEFVILFERTALNPQTMKNVSAWFVQKICYRIPNREGYDFHFFYWSKDVSLPHIKILDTRLGRLQGLCYCVIPSDAIYVKKVNQPKRLTKEQKIKITMNGEFDGIPCLGIFSETDGSEYVQPKSE